MTNRFIGCRRLPTALFFILYSLFFRPKAAILYSLGRRPSSLFFRPKAAILYSLFFSPAGALAQTDVTTTYQIGVGRTNVLDTYLSQEKFKGTGATFLGTVERREPGNRWSWLIEHEVNFASVDDRTETVKELQGDYTLLLGRYYQWNFGRWDVQAGGMGTMNLGFIYNTSNSNNPAQGRLSLNVMPSGSLSYHFPVWHRPWKVSYKVELPLVGVMFSPNYGQSYYEIFSLGQYDHNIVPTTFISTPNLRHQLMVDCAVSSRLTLRIGYLGNYQQADVNNLKSHIYSHRVMVGIVRNFTISKRP